MSNVLQHPAEHLTSNYKTDTDSNNYKLLSLGHEQHLEIFNNLNLVEGSRDIDIAEGFSLDKAGKNVLELRDNRIDEVFRKAIKVRIRSNLSAGLIEDINDIAETLFGDNFVSVSETWTLDRYNYEPAGLSLSIKNISTEQMKQFEYIKAILVSIKAGGVRLFWDIYWEIDTIIEIGVKVNIYTFESPLTDTSMTGRIPTPAYRAGVNRGGLDISANARAFLYDTEEAGKDAYKPLIERQTLEVETAFKDYCFANDLTGTKPDRNTHGSVNRRELEIGTEANASRFNAPLGEHLTGTLPERNTAGNVSRSDVEAHSRTQAARYESYMTGEHDMGTVPERRTVAATGRSGVELDGDVTAARYDHALMGTLPERNTVGGVDRSEVDAQAQAEAFIYKNAESGTKPERGTAGGVSRADVEAHGEVQTALYSDELVGTLPERNTAGTGLRLDVTVTGDAAAVLFNEMLAGVFPERNNSPDGSESAIGPEVKVASYDFNIKFCGTRKLGG